MTYNFWYKWIVESFCIWYKSNSFELQELHIPVRNDNLKNGYKIAVVVPYIHI